jgi:hypothetical protein
MGRTFNLLDDRDVQLVKETIRDALSQFANKGLSQVPILGYAFWVSERSSNDSSVTTELASFCVILSKFTGPSYESFV